MAEDSRTGAKIAVPQSTITAGQRAYPIIDHSHDVLVIGAGGAGLRAVLSASQAD